MIIPCLCVISPSDQDKHAENPRQTSYTSRGAICVVPRVRNNKSIVREAHDQPHRPAPPFSKPLRSIEVNLYVCYACHFCSILQQFSNNFTFLVLLSIIPAVFGAHHQIWRPTCELSPGKLQACWADSPNTQSGLFWGLPFRSESLRATH